MKSEKMAYRVRKNRELGEKDRDFVSKETNKNYTRETGRQNRRGEIK